ncbi:DUF3520 domain-containing protein, partial [candidate division GN15 bacterium]|nr:DUF3520 domain-containing protein [candidate division GN15 bacterium]
SYVADRYTGSDPLGGLGQTKADRSTKEIPMRDSGNAPLPTGSLTGIIIDSATGDPIAGATARILGGTNGAVSDLQGRFFVKSIVVGSCDVQIGAIGYLNREFPEVLIEPGQTADLDTIALSPVVEVRLIEELQVVGTRDVLEVFEVSNQVTITRDNEHSKASGADAADAIKHMPLANAKQQRDAGVTEKGNRYTTNRRHYSGTAVPDGLNRRRPGKTRSGEIPMRPRHPRRPDADEHPRFDAMFFEDYGLNPWTDTRRDNRSTFAADVDDASYVLTRSYLERGEVPPPDAVRTEEFINHFDYDYDGSFNETFRVFVEGATSPFAPQVDLVRIGIKGREVPGYHRQDANLVFVVDRSGSMRREDRLGLVKDALRMLLRQLRPNDRVAIVAFDTRAEIILRPTAVHHRHEIQRAINRLYANGSTNVDHGLTLGYELADDMFTSGAINKVMLLSDGVANTGRTQAEQILRRIKRYADKGITLSTVGVGMGNYNDVLLEKLGNKGNGGYAYVDSREEAARIFIEKLTGTLQVIARDVKIQVTFNPHVVARYRLLGYENRDVPDHKFRDDREDGGEIGAGHQVTAIYQVEYVREHRWPRANDLGTVAIRYKDPDNTSRVHEITGKISRHHMARSFERTEDAFQLAIVGGEFAEILRRANVWPGHASLAELEHMARELALRMESRQADELADLIRLARQHTDHLAEW